MLTASRFSVYRLWTCGILVLLVACAVLVGITCPVNETVGQDATAAKGTLEDQFDSPEAIVNRFSAELGRLASGAKIPSPNELAQQAEANKTCTVATLPDPGKKLDAETVYARARAGVVIVGAIPKAKKRHHSQPGFRQRIRDPQGRGDRLERTCARSVPGHEGRRRDDQRWPSLPDQGGARG